MPAASSRKRSLRSPGRVQAYLTTSENPLKKYRVTVVHPDGRRKTVHFGGVREDGKKYRDYTMHKDPAIMRRYLSSHRSREDWTRAGIGTAGFWARWLLWSKPSLKDAKALIEAKFNVEISRGMPPRPGQ